MISYFRSLINKARSFQYNEFIRGGSSSFVLKVIGVIFSQIFILIIGRTMGADAYGEFTLALSMITIVGIISTLGLDVAVLKNVASSKTKYKLSSYFTSLLITIPLSIIISFILYANSEYIASSFFNKPDITRSFEIASIGIVPFTLLKINSESLRGFKEIKQYEFLRFTATHLFSILFFLLFISLIAYNNSIIVTSFVFGQSIICLISFYYVFKKFFNSSVNIKFESAFKLLKMSYPFMLASSFMFINGWIDTIMVGYFMSSTDVGIYQLAFKIAALTSIIHTSINSLAGPSFAELEYDSVNLQRKVQQVSRLIFLTSLPVILFTGLFSEFILSLFSNEFSSGYLTLIILLAGQLVSVLAGSVGTIMKMTGKQMAFQNITLLTSVMGVVLNFILIPKFGIEGAAFASVMAIALWNVTSALYLKIRYNIQTYYNPIGDFRKWILTKK